MSEVSTLSGLLRARALRRPAGRAYTFLADGERETAHLTYGDLHERAHAIAARMRIHVAPGERVLLVYPPGLEYVCGFFGCLYANAIAVPICPPRGQRRITHLQSVAADAEARVALTSAPLLSSLKSAIDRAPDLQALTWIPTESIPGVPAEAWREPDPNPGGLAYLQYTSGSTTSPRGVVVSDANALHNLAAMDHAFEHTTESVAVTWLPHFHDMGLVYGILAPLYRGFPAYLMAPTSFIQRPIRWLQAISRYRATHSGGPNFAYDLCIEKSSPQERSDLDLSSWCVAFNGAEPVQWETLERFVEAFGPHGFQRKAFYPAYGLAEATLKVSGGQKAADPVYCRVDRSELEHNRVVEADDPSRVQTIVGCGAAISDTRIKIIDPESFSECSSGQVGEVWVEGPGVCEGYWNRPEESERTFQARVRNSAEGPFLRTGDLGFLNDGELFISGRLKDSIIIRGSNYQPEDIEHTVRYCHPVSRTAYVAAFSVEIRGEERLVVVHEVDRRLHESDIAQLVGAIREAVAEHHELQAHAVVIVKKGSIPKTSSGKVQRRACRSLFHMGGLEVISRSVLDLPIAPAGPQTRISRQTLIEAEPARRRSWMETYLREQLGRALRVNPARLDPTRSLAALGLDSIGIIELQHTIEADLRVLLPTSRFFEAPDLSQLAAQVLQELLSSAPELSRDAASPAEHPLSYGQQALWFQHQLEPASATYNITCAARIHGSVDSDGLRRAFQQLVDRHPSLRTTFRLDDGQAVARVHPHGDVWFEHEDASECGPDRMNGRLMELALRPFDLERGPLLRVGLFRCAAGEHVLLIAVHHIVADLWSLAVLTRELGLIYGGGRSDAGLELDLQRATPGDFARWQRGMLAGPEGERLWSYWRQQLAGPLPVLDLFCDRPRPPVKTNRGARHSFSLGGKLTQQLRILSQSRDATLYMTLLAGFEVLLYRYGHQEQLVVGSPVTLRSRSALANLVGYFVNLLAIRAELSGKTSFADLLARTRRTVLDAFDHEGLPFSVLVDRLHLPRDPSRSPLFDAVFVWQRAHLLEDEGLTPFAMGEPGARVRIGGLELERLPLEQRTSQFDLMLTMAEMHGDIRGELDYSTDLFDHSTVSRMMGHFRNLLEAIVAEPDGRLSELRLLSAPERQQLAVEWGGTGSNLPPQPCLHQQFEAQAELTPDAVALVFEGQRLTYRQLNHEANQLAHHLRGLGVRPETRVGLCVSRSLQMIVGLLGILKAGGAYVPLDPEYPQERLAFMLQDAGVPVLVTQERQLVSFADRGAQAVCLDRDWHLIKSEPDTNLDSGAAPENLAYVIYTSGSTGKPKGNLICHKNVTRLFETTRTCFHFGADDVWTLFHSYAFDFSVWEIWGALLHGGRLVVVPHELARSPQSFYDLLAEERVTILNQTPSAFYQLIHVEEARGSARDLALRLVISGGEALQPHRLKPWFDRHADRQPQLVNMYGITETTVHVTYRPVAAADAQRNQSRVGRPIADLTLYLLDGNLEPVPIGVAGEMHVGGAGLARGYLNRPDLTAERFCPSPFSAEPGARLYKTGDLARHLPDGDIEYLGRIDDQLKVRGFRVEPGEIEATLGQHPSLRDVLVMAREDEADGKQIVAYVVPRAEPAPSARELRLFLRTILPEYMTPAVFVFLESLPLTAHGKIDRHALPAPAHGRLGLDNVFLAPRTAVEEVLASIWTQVLGLEAVGIDDNFFELGGDSIRSIRILYRCRESGLSFSLEQLLQHPTIRELACAIQHDGTAAPPPPAKPPNEPFCRISAADRQKLSIDVHDAYPLSMLQAGMVFHSQYRTDYEIYVTSFHLQSPFDLPALEGAVADLVDRHPMLRTSFDYTSFSTPLQLVHRAARVPITVADLRNLPSAEQEQTLTAWIEHERRSRFDWSRAPLLRLHVHRRSETTFQLSFSEAIFDGWSIASLATELLADYVARTRDAEPPPVSPPAVSYGDFVGLEQQALQSPECQRYWARKLSDSTATRLALWKAEARPLAGLIQRSIVPIPCDLSGSLKSLARELSVPLKSVLLAAHLRVVSLLSGHTDILTGVMMNGRPEEPDGDRVLGLFLNTLPFRLDMSAGGTWVHLIRQAWDAERELLPFRRYPLARILKDHGGQPLFDTAFNFTHFHNYQLIQQQGHVALLGMSASDQTYFTLTAQFNLDLDSQLGLALDADANVLPATQLGAIADYYLKALQALACHPFGRYERQCLLSHPERTQFLRECNSTASARGLDAIHTLFEAQAARLPDRIAVVSEDARLTYCELNSRANQLACYLRRLGITPDVPVAICVERSLELIVGLLGILKAGGAYLPIDPAYPQDRVAFMIADAGAPVLLTQESIRHALPQPRTRVVLLDSDWSQIAQEGPENTLTPVAPENLAYVIYTSGSTGRPKGVMVSHGSVTHLFAALAPQFGLGEADVWTLFHSYSFDFSVWEIWGALLHGGRLVLVQEAARTSPPAFRELLRKHGVTVLNLTPSAYRVLMTAENGDHEHEPCLRLIALGGEALPQELAADVLKAKTPLWNFYGPAEATVWSSVQHVQSADCAIAIGRPIPNMQLHVLDSYQQPVPMAVPGEIYIGGPGLARGYLKRPALTAEKFIPNPFSDAPGARLYRTGDLGRYQPDGSIEYLGRIDSQVKVHGFRVELGEIQAVLSQHPAVRETVVMSREDTPGQIRLVAYVVPDPGQALTGTDLRPFLLEQLPAYMVPSAFVFLSAMPLSPNGKIAHQELPPPDFVASRSAEAFLAPRNAVEATLAGIWADVLNIAAVSVNDSFFELGGDSILSIQAVARANQAGLGLTHKQLFQFETVAALAKILNTQPPLVDNKDTPERCTAPLNTEELRRLVEQDEDIVDCYPLAPMQQGILFHAISMPDAPAYLVQNSCELRGHPNLEAFLQSWQKVIERNAALRTCFRWNGGAPFQLVRRHATLPVEEHDWRSLPAAVRQQRLQDFLLADLERRFELSRGPLMRLALVWTADDAYLCVWTYHHLVLDGWSAHLLWREVLALYDAICDGQEIQLDQPPTFRSYLAWLELQDTHRAEAFWRETLSGFKGCSLSGRTANQLGATPTSRYQEQRLELAATLATQLQAFARQNRLTMSTLLLGVWALIAGHLSGSDDVVFGSTVSGRSVRLAGIESIVGVLINTLPSRVRFAPDNVLAPWLQQLQLQHAEAQQYAYTSPASLRSWSEVLGNIPLFESILVFEVFSTDVSQPPQPRGLKLSAVRSVVREHYPLVVVITRGSDLAIEIKYDSTRFEASTIARMLGYFEALLSHAPGHPQIQLASLQGILLETDRADRETALGDRKKADLARLNAVRREAMRFVSPEEEAQ